MNEKSTKYGPFTALLRKNKTKPQFIAYLVGVDTRTVQYWHTGERCPQVGMLLMLSLVYDISLKNLAEAYALQYPEHSDRVAEMLRVVEKHFSQPEKETTVGVSHVRITADPITKLATALRSLELKAPPNMIKSLLIAMLEKEETNLESGVIIDIDSIVLIVQALLTNMEMTKGS